MKNTFERIELSNIKNIKNQITSLSYAISKSQSIYIAFENIILKNARNIKN